MKVCLQAEAVKQTENYFSVLTDGTEIRIWFLTDSIIRIRAGFDGDFAEESYSLVTTAWEDRMDDFMKNYRKRIRTAKAELTDGAEKAVIQGELLRVEVEKEPFRANHPKFPAFLDTIQKNAMQDGTIVEITVTTPDGRRYESNLKLKQEDLDLLEMFRHLK